MRIHSLERREHGECACPRLDFVWDHNNKSFYQLVGWKCIIQLYFKAQLSNLNDLILYNIFNIVFSTNKVITQTTGIFFSHRELGNTSINMNIYKSQGISWCCLFTGYTPPPPPPAFFIFNFLFFADWATIIRDEYTYIYYTYTGSRVEWFLMKKKWALGKLCQIVLGPQFQNFTCNLTWGIALENIDCYPKMAKKAYKRWFEPAPGVTVYFDF